MKTASFSVLTSKLGPFVSSSQNRQHNQTIMTFRNGTLLKSYRSVVGIRLNDGSLYLSGLHDYSQTTNKQVGNWCGMGVAERRKGLENGSIGFIQA